MEIEGKPYLAMWESIRRELEALTIDKVDAAKLDALTKMIERAQKNELALREDRRGEVIVVNVHIPGVCDKAPPASKANPPTGK
jgi:hypothetical protein